MPGPGLGIGERMASVAVIVLHAPECTASHPKWSECCERASKGLQGSMKEDGQQSQSISTRRSIQQRMFSFEGEA